MPGPVSILEILTSFSKPSTRQRAAVWVSGYLSAARSSRDIMAASGPSQTMALVPSSRFLFPAVQTTPWTRHSRNSWAARRGALHQLIELRCLPEEAAMGSSTAIASVNDVRAFIDEYFKAWEGTDEDLILSYYSENVSLEIPGTIINGKAALRDQ